MLASSRPARGKANNELNAVNKNIYSTIQTICFRFLYFIALPDRKKFVLISSAPFSSRAVKCVCVCVCLAWFLCALAFHIH